MFSKLDTMSVVYENNLSIFRLSMVIKLLRVYSNNQTTLRIVDL